MKPVKLPEAPRKTSARGEDEESGGAARTTQRRSTSKKNCNTQGKWGQQLLPGMSPWWDLATTEVPSGLRTFGLQGERPGSGRV